MKNHTAKVHIMCGFVCAGKTILSKKLALETNAIRYSTDEWLDALYETDGSFDQTYRENRAKCKNLIWKICQRNLSVGVDVILDFGFWTKTERDLYKVKAIEAGATPILHYLPVEVAVLKQRLQKRNLNLPPGDFYISDDHFNNWLSWFEPPDSSEKYNNLLNTDYKKH